MINGIKTEKDLLILIIRQILITKEGFEFQFCLPPNKFKIQDKVHCEIANLLTRIGVSGFKNISKGIQAVHFKQKKLNDTEKKALENCLQVLMKEN